ncbi:hypothetical protein NE237_019723 [Protea cynaroides]|uniref:Retrovirus-related Pol polyprotein from transposon TNT 1-94-like beta-barrel domain-containing protein n=1 Tax=Protea cynaroides TaxID=273540 RepID=A0A9Q0H7N8_9MAGN|nr:hypothetical protein NE237_019723 [Protea cynaroides]
MPTKPQLWLHSSTHRTMVAHPIMMAMVIFVGTSPLVDVIHHKLGHITIDYYNHMNHTYQDCQPPEKLTAMVAAPFTHLATWYSDTSASHHVTLDIDNLHITTPYDSPNTVQVGNGPGLPIEPTDSSIFPSLSLSSFKLNNILHCPIVATNLLSVH